MKSIKKITELENNNLSNYNDKCVKIRFTLNQI